MLQPGAETVARLGGLHRFMGWDGPMLTNSGGFQIFSASAAMTATASRRWSRSPRKAPQFRSHIDGSMHMLTPERSIEIQRILGADLVVALDECPHGRARPRGDGEARSR